MHSLVLVFGVKLFALATILHMGVLAAQAQEVILPSQCAKISPCDPNAEEGGFSEYLCKSNGVLRARCETITEIIENPSEPEVVTKLVQEQSCSELSSLWAWYNDGYWDREDEFGEQSRLLAYLEESGEGEGETARTLRQELAELSLMREQHQLAWHRVKLAANIKGCEIDAERRSEATANGARLESVFYSQIYRCWDNVVDLPNPETLNVRLQVTLDEDGNVQDRIRLLEPAREPLGRDPMRVAIERARRAVHKCAPYQLPRQDYALWQSITVSLGPRFGDVVR